MDIEPRFDVYRQFDEPDRVMVVATGVSNGELRTIGFSVRADDPAYSEDEGVVRGKLEPLLQEMWAAAPKQ